jgi:hypothetical protein
MGRFEPGAGAKELTIYILSYTEIINVIGIWRQDKGF